MNKDRKLLRPEMNDLGLGITSLRKLPNSSISSLLKKSVSISKPLYTSKFLSSTKFQLKSRRNSVKSSKNFSTAHLINISNTETKPKKINYSIIRSDNFINNSSGNSLGTFLSTYHNHNLSNPIVSGSKSTKNRDISIRRSYNQASLHNFHLSIGMENETTEAVDIVNLPTTASKALKYYRDCLTLYEHREIFDYREVYYLGKRSDKILPSFSQGFNYGFDDEKGDYYVIKGDHIIYRYEIIGILGKGSFGVVLRVFDHRLKQPLALKIIKNKSRFTQQSAVEVKILKYLKDIDRNHEYNIVHFQGYFKFRNHLCITFELLSINLYELLKSNAYQGLTPALICRFAVQILTSLSMLRKHRVIHCDLKLENILLVHPNKSLVKIIDFGSSCFHEEKIYTYIQSRYYRAPEIILGIPYSSAIDMWSFGCILVELCTGRPLFPGKNEVQQLQMIMEVLGLPPGDIMKISTRKKIFFDSEDVPKIIQDDRGNKHFPGAKALRDILKGTDEKFIDLVNSKVYTGCLEWDPENRITPNKALESKWILDFSSQATGRILRNSSMVFKSTATKRTSLKSNEKSQNASLNNHTMRGFPSTTKNKVTTYVFA